MKKSAIFSLLMYSTIFTIEMSAQPISTVAEIYDYEIGDVFHQRFYESVDIYWVERLSGRTVVDKYYSFDGDTLYYDFEGEQMEMGIENPEWVYSTFSYTASYTNLDSLINDGQIDSVSTDPNLYNGRLINYYVNDNYPNTYNRYRYVNGCGRAYHTYNGYGFGYSETELRYYNKGGEEWGNPILLLSTPEGEKESMVRVYPNPAHNFLNVQLPAEEVFQASIINLLGDVVQSISVSTQSARVPVLDLTPGIYFLVLESEKDMISHKFVKD
jgi:hypothetical protein